MMFSREYVFCCCVAIITLLAYHLLFKPSGGGERRQSQQQQPQQQQQQPQQQQEQEPRPCTTIISSSLLDRKPSKTFLKESIPADSIFARFVMMIREVQDQLCASVIALDGGDAQFKEHLRDKGDDGGCIIMVLEDSDVWDKVIVTVQVIYGVGPTAFVVQELYGVGPTASVADARTVPYMKAGINAVFHPKNPFAPTMHFNYWCIETNSPQDATYAPGTQSKWLFTGACDLIPAYIFEDDVKLFHSTLKGACEKFVPTIYHRFKQHYDYYFAIKHRDERRGLEGIYFDELADLNSNRYNEEKLLSFVTECAKSVSPVYVSIIEKRKNLSFTIQNKVWQQLQRGRFVEFLLVCDCFITSTLKSDGTTGEIIDDILYSLPLTARWEYYHIPNKGSEEQKLLDVSKSRLPKFMKELQPRPFEAPQSSIIFTQFVKMMRKVQDHLLSSIVTVDGGGSQFKDVFQSCDGCTCVVRVLQDSIVWDKAMVMFTVDDSPVFSAFIRTILHPKNPFAPTFQLFFKCSETNPRIDASGVVYRWRFDGGTDLIPAYIFEEDAKLFHSTLKGVCDKFDPTFYPLFKKQCDDYFFIKHRGERRGLGGILFDDLTTDTYDTEMLLSFISECANGIIPVYKSIIEKRKNLPFTYQNKVWQQLRRGRFVEFNLVCHKGTTYAPYNRGQIAEGRIERIFSSLPLTARWEYNYIPDEGSEERKLLDVCIKPKEWA